MLEPYLQYPPRPSFDGQLPAQLIRVKWMDWIREVTLCKQKGQRDLEFGYYMLH